MRKSLITTSSISFVAALLGAAPDECRGKSTPTNTIVDLSIDFSVGDLDSPGAKTVIDSVTNADLKNSTRRFLVLEKGEIVVDYTRIWGEGCRVLGSGYTLCGVAPNDVWLLASAASVFDGLWMGHLLESGRLSTSLNPNDTLGDIFQDDNSIWETVTDADYKKSVTVYELLTMTSGMGSDFILREVPDCFLSLVNNNYGDVESFILGGYHDWVKYGTDSAASCLVEFLQADQKDLVSSLEAFTVINGQRGRWNFVENQMTYSYIFKQLTGLGPREYMSSNIFPALGIDNDRIHWVKNSDGLDFSAGNMALSVYDMAKLGQLYLQNGMSGPNTSLISADWVKRSLTNHVDNDADFYGYGFWWWVYNSPTVGEYYCAVGSYGQFICIAPEQERVYVRQSDSEYDPLPFLPYDMVALERSTSYSSNSAPWTDTPATETIESSAESSIPIFLSFANHFCYFTCPFLVFAISSL